MKLTYAPGLYKADYGYRPPTVPETAYYRWQVRLWEYLSKRKDLFTFWVVLDRYPSQAMKDPIVAMKADNIAYISSYGSVLRGYIELSDAVLVNHLSTPVFDANECGRPVIHVPLWEEEVREVDVNGLENVQLESLRNALQKLEE